MAKADTEGELKIALKLDTEQFEKDLERAAKIAEEFLENNPKLKTLCAAMELQEAECEP